MAADFSPASLRKSRLRAELQLVAARYGVVNSDQQDGSWVHVPHFPLPEGWNKSEVEILIDIPYGNPGYPRVAPEWFWTDRDLATADGRSIGHFFTEGNNRYTDRMYLEKGWGHFCVHLRGWQPAAGVRIQDGHTLLSYLDLIQMIFRDRNRLGG